VHFSLDANDALAEANSTLFHSAKELQDEFTKNSVGSFAGFDFYKQLSLPTHTNGAGAGYLVNGASQSGSSLVVKTGTGAVPKGTIFTLAGVNGVHPITGLDNGTLRQFVVTADYAGGAGTISIYPAITVDLGQRRGHGVRGSGGQRGADDLRHRLAVQAPEPGVPQGRVRHGVRPAADPHRLRRLHGDGEGHQRARDDLRQRPDGYGIHPYRRAVRAAGGHPSEPRLPHHRVTSR
jgi:hypothetical protein